MAATTASKAMTRPEIFIGLALDQVAGVDGAGQEVPITLSLAPEGSTQSNCRGVKEVGALDCLLRGGSGLMGPAGVGG